MFFWRGIHSINFRTVNLSETVLVGSGTTIGDSTFINNSVIGENCVIGANVRITGCYIMNNVTIDSGCILNKSIIGENSLIAVDVDINSGCIIDRDCAIGPNVSLPSRNMLSLIDSGADDKALDQVDLGEQAKGKIYIRNEDDFDTENFVLERSYLGM
jgi:translation initiation factor eIF-2B subunit epsilon